MTPAKRRPRRIALQTCNSFTSCLEGRPFRRSRMREGSVKAFASFSCAVLIASRLISRVLILNSGIRIAFPRGLEVGLLRGVKHVEGGCVMV